MTEAEGNALILAMGALTSIILPIGAAIWYKGKCEEEEDDIPNGPPGSD